VLGFVYFSKHKVSDVKHLMEDWLQRICGSYCGYWRSNRWPLHAAIL